MSTFKSEKSKIFMTMDDLGFVYPISLSKGRLDTKIDVNLYLDIVASGISTRDFILRISEILLGEYNYERFSDYFSCTGGGNKNVYIEFDSSDIKVVLYDVIDKFVVRPIYETSKAYDKDIIREVVGGMASVDLESSVVRKSTTVFDRSEFVEIDFYMFDYVKDVVKNDTSIDSIVMNTIEFDINTSDDAKLIMNHIVVFDKVSRVIYSEYIAYPGVFREFKTKYNSEEVEQNE